MHQLPTTRQTLRLGIFFLVLAAAPLYAGTENTAGLERLHGLKTRVHAHQRTKDAAALKADVEEALRLHGDLAGEPAQCEQVLDLLGGIARQHALPEVVDAALLGLAETKDAAAARYLRAFLKPADGKRTLVGRAAAIRAAGMLPHESLSDLLLKIVEKSKDYDVAAMAVTALGSYGKFERRRCQIVERLIASVRRSQSSSGGRGRAVASGGETQLSGAMLRWSKLSRVLPGALNQMTGRSLLRVTDWFDLAKENKGHIDSLFQDA